MNFRLAAAIALNEEIFDRLRSLDILWQRTLSDNLTLRIFTNRPHEYWDKLKVITEGLVEENSGISLWDIHPEWDQLCYMEWDAENYKIAESSGPVPRWIINGDRL